MISELNFKDATFGFLFVDVNLDNFHHLVKVFEDNFHPTEKVCVSGWHDVIYEYVLEKFGHNKIRIECVDEIVTIVFIKLSDDKSKNNLKNIAQFIDAKLKNESLGSV